MNALITVVLTTIGVAGVGLLIVLFLALPVMWLWNWLFTSQVTMMLFGIDQLTWTKALGLTILCSFLFKSSSSSSSK